MERIDEPDLLVVGSAAILGSYDDAELPVAATRSDEADIAAFGDRTEDRSHEIEGSLGAGSPFHDEHGYFADGVDLSTAIVPNGWKDRLVLYASPGSKPGRSPRPASSISMSSGSGSQTCRATVRSRCSLRGPSAGCEIQAERKPTRPAIDSDGLHGASHPV